MFFVWSRPAAALTTRAAGCGYYGNQIPGLARLQFSVLSSHSEMPQDVKSFNDIPGPRGLPYFGTYFKYKLGAIDIHKLPETLQQWHHQYGGIVKETRLGHTVVHIFDPEAIRTVYANEDKWPRIEPLAETTQLYRQKSGMSPGLGNTNDEEWYRLRRAVQQLMMRPKEVVPFLPGVDSVALDFIARIRQLRNHSNEVPDFAMELGCWSLESSGMNCFNCHLNYLREEGRKEAESLVQASYQVFDLTTQLSFSLPVFKYLTTPKWKKLFIAEDVLYKGLQEHLNVALEKLKLKTEKEQLADDEFIFLRYLMARKELTLNDIATLTLSLFIDGLPTTTQQLLFMLYLLASNPEVQDKAYKEIQSVAPPYPAPLTADGVNRMSYIRACIKESVRMLPMTNEISRITKKDMVLGGYHIPAKTPVHLDNQVQYRNPDLFRDPNTYMPERWLRDSSMEKVDPFILLPFGHGPRMCAGRRFAEQDMAVLLTRILQNFRLEWHHPPMGLKYMTLNVPDCPARYTFCDR